MNQELQTQGPRAIVRADAAASSQSMIASPAAWRAAVQSRWSQLKQQADQSTLASPYQKLVMMVFSPVMPNPTTKLTLLRRLLKKYRYCGALSKRLTDIYRDRNYARTAEELARDELCPKNWTAKKSSGWIG